MTETEIQNWADASSEFFAAMFDQLNDNPNTTTPMLAPGVIIRVLNQDRYVASTGNFGGVNYGVDLEVNFVVTYQTSIENPVVNVANAVLKIFDRDSKGNLIFFSPYLSALRFTVGSTFSSVNKMSINANSERYIDLPSPIPTLPLPPPTDPPTVNPSASPTITPTMRPTPGPTTLAPTLSPTIMASMEPTLVPTLGTADPTMAPTTSNPTAPDETYAPTPEPEPTASPTRKPTARPTLALESFFAASRLYLEGLDKPLDFNATFDFQMVTAGYISTIVQDLLRDITVDEVTVGLSSQSVIKPQTSTDGTTGTRRRRLQTTTQDQDNLGPSKLQVEFNTILKIRSTTSVNAPSLIQSAFGTAGRRENYRLLLLASQDPILQQITMVSWDSNINRPGELPASSGGDGGLGTPALIGIGAGALLFAMAILGIWYKASSNKKRGDDGDSQKGQIPTAQMSNEENGGLKGRLDAEIVFNNDADDVSTLGDPFFGMSLEERTCADKTATSASVQQSYDFMKLMEKGANALLGTTAEADEESETASKVRRNTLFADDDASFEDMFGEMK